MKSMKKNKRYTYSDEIIRRLLLKRDTDITEFTKNILFKEHEEELKQEFPDKTEEELKQEVVKKYSDQFNKMSRDVIAPFYPSKVSDFIKLDNNSVILTNDKKYNKEVTFAKNTKLVDTYANMHLKTDMFDVIERYGTSSNNTKKKQTGSALIKKVIQFDKLNYSYTTVKASQSLAHANKAYEFFKKSKKFMVYDYETMGGTDEFGYKRVDAVTEFAYSLFDKTTGESKTINTIVGLSPEQAKRFGELIKNVNRDGVSSNEQEVIYRRIGLYGHKDTRIEKGADGMYEVKKMADLEYGHRFTDSDLKRGIDRLREVYDEQAKLGTTPGGLYKWQERYATMIGLMSQKDMSVLDYNGIVADRPWQNKFLATMGLNEQQKKEFMHIAGINDMFLDTTSERFYDVRVHTRFAANNVGSEAYYATKEAKKRLGNNTPFSQEGITRTLFAEEYEKAGGGAHTAGFDTQLLGKLAMDPTGFGMEGETFVDRIHRDANVSTSAINKPARSGNLDLFMANESVQFYGGGSGPLSYVYDPVSGNYRTANKFSIGEKVSEEFTKENPVKRGRLYTLDFAGQVNMTDKWVKGMEGLHDEYAQKALYMIKLNPYFDESVAGAHQGLRGHSVLFFNSKEQMEATLSNMMKIGERDNTTSSFQFLKGKAGEEVKEMFTTYQATNGTLEKVETPDSIDKIVTKATYADINDTAARMIREDSYTKAMNFSKFYKKLEEYNGAPVNKQQAHNILLQLMAAKDKKISKKVSKGKVLELSYHDVVETLGYSLDKGKTHQLITNTLNNQLTAFDYMASQNKVFEEIRDYFYEKGYTSEEAKFKFDKILSALTEQQIAKSKQGDRTWYNSKPTQLFGKDLNYFNFNVENFFNEKAESTLEAYSKPAIDEDILRIDLGPGKEYNFVNNLLRRTRYNTEMNASQKNNEGITQLRRFVQNVQESKQYGTLFEQFTEERISEYTKADMFASSIIQELRDYRKVNPTAGYIAEAYTQDATIESKLLKDMEKDVNLRKNIVAIDDSLPIFATSKGDKNITRSHAENIVNSLIDDIDPYDYAKQYNFTDVQAKHMRFLYGKAKEEYTDFMTEFLDAFTAGEKTFFAYDTKKKNFALFDGQKAIHIELPKLKALDGNFFIDMGTSKIALHAKIDASQAINSGKYTGAKDFDVITTLGSAFKDTSRTLNFYGVAQKGDRNGDILRRAQSVLQNVKKGIRSGASVDYNDVLDIQAPYRVDQKDLMGLAPLLKQSKLLEGRSWRDPEFLSELKPGVTFDKSSDAYRELFQKNIPELLRVLAEEKGGFNEDSWIGLIAKNMSFLGKETQGADLVGMIQGIVHRPGAQVENNMRPVINQTRAVLYSTEEWEKALNSEDFKERNVSLRPITDTSASSKILNRELTGVGRTSVGLQVGKLNISEIGYRGAVTDYFGKKGYLTSREEKVFDKLKSVNLTEQEQVLDPRIASAFFNRMQEQKINARKQLNLFMDINEETIETVKELSSAVPSFEVDPQTGTLQFKYGKGVQKKRRDKLLEIEGFSSPYVHMSKITGKFKQGFFSKTDGILINEKEINHLIAGFKTQEEAMQFLEETFDKSWYVRPNDMITYKKILNGFTEKGMANILAFGLGESDEKVNEYLSLTDKKMLGHVASDAYIDEEILDKFDMNIGKRVGIKSKEELKDLIYKERNEAFDTLREIFGQKHDFGLIANHSQGKHGNTQLNFEETVGTMKYLLMTQGMSEDEAMTKVFNDLTNEEHKVINMKDVYLKDGVIQYPEFLEGGKDNYDRGALEIVLAKDEYREMESGLRMEYAGKEVGNFAMTTILEARDSQMMSSKTDPQYIESIANLQEKAKLATTPEEKAKYEAKIQSYLSSLEWNTKGQKISDREIQMLDLQRYDQSLVDTMQQRLDKDTFESTMGHVLQKDSEGNFVKDGDRYLLDKDVEGRSMLSGMTDAYRKKFMSGQGGTTFNAKAKDINKTLKAHYEDEEVRSGIKKLVTSEGKISKDTAEHLYSLSRGEKAVRFNGAHSYSLEQMEKEGFHIKKAGEIFKTFDEGKWSLEHEDSMFNKNLMIDFGEDFLDSERYMAVPYAPSKLTGNTVVRENFQKKLGAVLTSYDKIQDFQRGVKQPHDTREKLMANFRRHRTELQQEIELFSATGKEGNMGEFYVRLDESFVGKASGVVALNPLELEELIEQSDSDLDVHDLFSTSYRRALINADGDEKRALAFMNYAPLSQSEFLGKSVLDHYKDGVYINASYAGEEIFKDLGIFSDEYLKESGFESMDVLKEHLRTEGIVTNALRTPTIKMDSIAPAILYLDDSLKDRKVKTLLEGSLARTEDYDGDQPIFSVFKTINGEDSIMAAKKGHSNDLVWKDIQANILARGTGSFQYFHDEAYRTLIDDAEKAFENGDFVSLTGDIALDNKIYAEFNISKPSEAIAENNQTLEELQGLYEKQYGNRFNLSDKKDVSNVSDLIDTMSGETRERYLKAAAFESSFAKTEIGGIAKVRKNAIGEISNPLARLRRVADIALPRTGPDADRRELLQKAFEDIEQEVISAKKGSYRDYWDKLSTFKSALNDLTSGDAERKVTGRKQMEDWLNINMNDYFQKSMTHLKAMNKGENFDSDQAFNYIRDTFVETIGSFDTPELQKLKQYDTLGSNIRAYGLMMNSGDFLKYAPKDDRLLKNIGVNTAVNAGLLESTTLIEIEKIQQEVTERLHGPKEQVLKDHGEFINRTASTLRQGASEIAQSMQKGFAELTSSKLGLASMGLAAAYMITGFIGNNASQPADMQAAQQMAQSQQQEPQLSDYNQSYASNASANKGYVINVKGNGSPQTLARAKQNISQTMGNSLDANINVSMNIMESDGNINDRYLDELLVNAIER